VEISFTPGGVSWTLWMKSPFPQVRPETINVGHVENHPPPLGNGITLFQIQDRVFDVLGAERRKACCGAVKSG
jgi:hypothetical protein